jgi:hypothetical protein
MGGTKAAAFRGLRIERGTPDLDVLDRKTHCPIADARCVALTSVTKSRLCIFHGGILRRTEQ